MHSILAWKLFRVTRELKQPPFSRIRTFRPHLRYFTHCIKMTAVDTQHFKGKTDRYNGVTVDSVEEPRNSEAFVSSLDASLQQWIQNGIRTVWFRVHLSHTEWVPILTKQGFKFHHAKDNYVTLYRWLCTTEECNIPSYAHTDLGVGAFVYNEKTNEVLVIKEKYFKGTAMWKLPGGYVEPGEDLHIAIQREVLEETGIEADFKSLIAFRHIHNFHFGCSDIYMLCYLSPRTFNIQKCNREISDCRWMKLENYEKHPEVSIHNKEVARKLMEFLEHRMAMTLEHRVHPDTRKPFCIYSISEVKDRQTVQK